MVLMIGLGCWALAILALARILRSTPAAKSFTQRGALLWTLLILFAVLLLFRPHEDIFGGQDPGAYLNASVSFVRYDSLFHTDPLLAKISVESRPEFLYGHAAFGKTKDACLWIRDPAITRIGPWFQPAYSVMMSPLAALTPAAILYVAPLLALLTGLVLACLARRLVAHPWAAVCTFLLYVLMPVIAWNARCPRAELGAAFFLYAGWALILNAWRSPRWQHWPDLVTGAVCLGVAPFFHITAWHPVIASFAVLAATAMAGRTDFLPTIPVALLAATGFVAHTRYVTDCYFIWRFIEPVLARGRLLAPVLVAGLVAITAVSLTMRKHEPSARRSRVWRLLGMALAVLAPLLFLAISLARNELGQIPFLSANSAPYLALSDFRGLMKVSSPLAAGIAIAGWVWLTWRRDSLGLQLPRVAFFVALLPGLLLTGWMNDYMMETRRMLIVPAPLMALCGGTILAAGLSMKSLHSRFAAAAAGVLLVITMAAHKTQLYTVTEYRNLYDFLKPFAGVIQREQGMLLAEYSRIAAPFEHFFGIPLLAIDSDRHTDYRGAVKAWTRLMEKHPGQACFFLTPYPDPVSDQMDFIPVRKASYHGRSLPSARGAIPPSARTFDLDLYLYRIAAKDAGLAPARGFNRSISAGNMGMRLFDRVFLRPRQISGVSLPPGKNATLSWSAATPQDERRDVLMFFHTDTGTNPAVAIDAPAAAPARWAPLAGGWWIATLANTPASVTSAVVRSSAPDVMLYDLQERTSAGTLPVPWNTSEARGERMLAPFAARWARSKAEMMLPAHPGQVSDVFLFLQLDAAQTNGTYNVTVNKGEALALNLTPGLWGWRAVSVSPAQPPRDRLYLSFLATPPWDPKLRGFPTDLAVVVGYAVVMPARESSAGNAAP